MLLSGAFIVLKSAKHPCAQNHICLHDPQIDSMKILVSVPVNKNQHLGKIAYNPGQNQCPKPSAKLISESLL